MRRFQPWVLLLLCSFRGAAQSCPSVVFRNASQQILHGQTNSGLQRQADGSFTLHSYTVNHTVASVQQLTPTPQYQTAFYNCTGRAPQQLVPPANWSFLGNPLLGTMSRNPAIGSPLSGGEAAGFCLSPCGFANTLQMVVGNTSDNIASAPAYTVSENAFVMVTADLNNDGLADLIVANDNDATPATLSIYLMQANGTLATPTTITFPDPGDLAATAADFNGDGKLDLAVANDDDFTITVLLGNGDGTFQAPIVVNTGEYPVYLAAADLNGDGKLDLVAASPFGIIVHFGNGDGTFQGPQSISGPAVTAIAVADLNKDGKPDIVASSANNGAVLVWLNAGNGTFPNFSAYVVGDFDQMNQMFLMDFDWDGNVDIVFAAGHPDALVPAVYSGAVTVLFGNGDGTFYGIPAYSVGGGYGAEPRGLTIADFNGDGKPDALAGSTAGIAVMIGKGDGTFTPKPVMSQGSTSVAAGDFTNDGNMDFVATNQEDNIFVFLGAGNGTFQQAPTISTESGGLTAAVTADFNGDGKLDFAVVDSYSGTSGVALVYLGKGDGTFQSPATLSVGSGPVGLQAMDVNGDGKIDLVVTNEGTYGSSSDPGSVAVLFGNGDGTFQTAVQYAAGGNPAFSLVADINGDGKPDLITSTTVNPTTFAYGLSVRLNQGNGVFGPAQSLNSEYGPAEIAAADFNGDGKVDLLVAHCCGPETDMGYFLGNGDGTFQPEATFLSGDGQRFVQAADLTGDGKPDAVFMVSGGFVAPLVNLGTVTGSTAAITIQTAPAGLQFTVDGGAAQTAPQTLNLSLGTHTIAVATPQSGAVGTQYVFSSWSDGGAASHSIAVGSSAATYTATFSTQYRLTVSASPAAGGTVAPASGNFYNAGTVVSISATPNSGYTFSGWTGSVASASSASTTVTMSAPETVTANFSSSGGTFSLSPTSANVLALAGSGTVTVTAPSSTATWTAVSNSSFLTIASGASGTGNGTVGYSVAANTTGSARTGTLTIAGLTFTVTQSAVTTAGQGFFPVTPCRVVDTRTGQGFTGQFGPPTMTANQTRSFTIPSGGCNIPATAQAYSLNVTVVPPAGLGYLTIWPTGQTQPYVSTLNSLNGAIIANAAIVPAGTGGAVSVFVTNATDVVIDINGYFAPPTGPALAFYPVTPCRVADTRNPNGPFGGPSLGAGGTRNFTVPSSACGIPSTAQAYSLNMTVVPPGPLEYLTAWPAGQTQPYVSTLNALQGQIAANAAIVPAGAGGAISVYVSDPSNVIIDINGYFAPPGGAGALYFYPVTPCRVADTRNPTGALGGPSLGAGATRTFPVPSSSCGLPTTAQAYSFNMTVVPPGQLFYLTTWPAGQAQPVVSTLNDLQGQIVANAAIVPAGASGAISVYVSDAANVVIDVNGYFGQ